MNFSSYNTSVSISLINQEDMGSTAAKYVIVLVLGFSINFINGTLIFTFRKHQVFYTNPRYILFIHLVVNDMILLTSSISLYIYVFTFYKINVSFCFFGIIAALFTTRNTPLNLVVMSVERYIAVCFPLRHASLCTVRRTLVLIVCIWVLSSLTVLFQTIILLSTEPLGFFHSMIVCMIETLFRHPISFQIREITYIISLTVVWFTLFFTYFKIFFAARAANSADGKAKKARNTILLHGFQLLLSMLTYIDPLVKPIVISWFPKYVTHVRFVWYVTVHIFPRCISPIVYGLRDQTFKQHLKKNFNINLFLLHSKIHCLAKKKVAIKKKGHTL